VRVPDPSGALNPGSALLTISVYLKVAANLVAGDYNVVQKGQASATGGAYKLEIFGKASSTDSATRPVPSTPRLPSKGSTVPR
jgi:hypothetical protein